MESEQENMVNLRQKLRDDDCLFRMQKRSLVYNAKRAHLGEVTMMLKVPSLDEVCRLSSSLKKNKDPETLRRLQLGFSVGEERISKFLTCSGALYSLNGLLTGHDEVLQIEAACCLVNLALGSEKQCYEVSLKSVSYLLTSMASNNPLLQDPSAWCIGNLCGNHKSVCKLLLNQGGEAALLQLIGSYAPNVLQSACYALVHYFTTVPERISVVASQEVCRQLVNALNHFEETDMMVDISWCLFVCSTNHNTCAVLVDQGIIQSALTALERLVSQNSLNVKAATPLVRVIINCTAAVSGTAIQVCYCNDQFVKVSTFLLHSPCLHMREETQQMIANVINTASADELTGKCIVDDLNMQSQLENGLKSSLAANFSLGKPRILNFS